MALNVYKNRAFARFQAKARISDSDLLMAATQAEHGLIEADLGGGVIKQRIARRGQGKSGGSRSIIAFRQGHLAIFVYGFEKKDRANIRPDELAVFRNLARDLLALSESQIGQQLSAGFLIRVLGKE